MKKKKWKGKSKADNIQLIFKINIFQNIVE